MTTFDDREQAYESKFAHDTDKRFREGARAVKMVALWAAEMMGKADEEADAYVTSLLTADFFEAGNTTLKLGGSTDITSGLNQDQAEAWRITSSAAGDPTEVECKVGEVSYFGFSN